MTNMTNLVVSRRSGILRAPDGTLYRIERGRTLADGRHPAVEAAPQDWEPVTVELVVDDGPIDADGATAAEWAERLGEVQATADGYAAQLTRVVAVLDARGLVPADVDREREGWLVDVLAGVLDELSGLGDAELDQPATTGPEPAAAEPLADPETADGRAAIREWAWANGHEVAERGQLPRAIVDAYRTAHGG